MRKNPKILFLHHAGARTRDTGNSNNEARVALKDYPRVLILGESFRLTSGGGITLANLFRNWPSQNLANIHDIRERDFHCCENHYVAANSSYWSLIFKHPVKATGVVENNLELIPISSSTNSPNNVTGMSRLVRFFEKSVLPHWMLQDTKLNDELKSWIDEFNPQLLYYQPSVSSLRLALNIFEYISCPIVLHYMDDWPMFESAKPRLFRPFIRRWIHNRMMRITSEAIQNMAISKRMAKVYQNRYGATFLPFQNPVDVSRWAIKPSEAISSVCDNHCNILFPGKINQHNVKTLYQIAQAAENISNIIDSVTLSITDTPCNLSQYYKLDKYLIGRQNYQKMPTILSSYDILLLPFGFERESITYAKLSMPTKVPEFLASGIPILVIAPASTALSEYATSDNWAIVVNSIEISAISNAIVQLRDPKVRLAFSLKARAIAKKNHAESVVRDSFESILFDAALNII